MIFAHLPSGYLLARALRRRRGPVMWAALIGSIFPDFDLAWFYLIDPSVFHHYYLTHIPGFWLCVATIVLPLLRLAQQPLLPAIAFFGAVMVHMVLDTVAGGILWLWPWNNELIQLFVVQATGSHWIISFMRHPTFVLEAALIATAGILFFTPERP